MAYTIPSNWVGEKLNIALVGCGGTGSELISKLFKMAFLLEQLGSPGFALHAYDPDTVSPFNVGRQSFWPMDVGENKADVLVTRFNNFGGRDWDYFDRAFTINDIQNYDIVLSCTDKASVRAELGKASKKNGFSEILWIDGGNDSHQGQVVTGHLCSNTDNYIPNIFNLYPELEFKKDDPRQSCSHHESIAKQDLGINATVAEVMANHLWKILRYGGFEHNISMIDIKELSITSIEASKEQWACFGYKEAS